MGKSILNMDLYYKMQYLNDIINLNFDGKCCDNFSFKLNKLYNYSELENLVQKIMPESEIESSGIIFYPKTSGNCIIFIDKKIEKITIETKNNEKIDDKTINFIINFCDFLKARTYSYENENKKKILYITKTDIPDVYDLFENKNDSKIGIAHIPNLKISHYCKENIIEPFTKVCCIYNNKFDKWIPINVIN
jgi:phage pi2 protein 07